MKSKLKNKSLKNNQHVPDRSRERHRRSATGFFDSFFFFEKSLKKKEMRIEIFDPELTLISSSSVENGCGDPGSTR
jgi:hypothetical protein